jgi:hypothetical protein
MAHGALKVAKNPLGSSKVNFPRIMHVKADLLHGVGDVRPCESQVLEGAHKAAVGCGISNSRTAHKAAVGCGISNSRTNISRDFGTSVDWGGARIAGAHAVALQDVQSILTL